MYPCLLGLPLALDISAITTLHKPMLHPHLLAQPSQRTQKVKFFPALPSWSLAHAPLLEEETSLNKQGMYLPICQFHLGDQIRKPPS